MGYWGKPVKVFPKDRMANFERESQPYAVITVEPSASHLESETQNFMLQRHSAEFEQSSFGPAKA